MIDIAPIIKNSLNEIAAQNRIDKQTLWDIFKAILNAKATPAQIGAFLMGLQNLGVSENEIVPAAMAMRSEMIAVDIPYPSMDVCGTGGDGAHSLNVSTAVSIIVAGVGHKVAKHGNRSLTSKCGAADVLEALGVKLRNDEANYKKSLDEANLAFFFAPNHHPKLINVAHIRRELGFGTIFNMLGPLCNPTNAKKQLLGVFKREIMMPMAKSLTELGSENFWVIHGEGGLDEATLSGKTYIIALKHGQLKEFEISPQDANLPQYSIESIKGGDANYNAKALMDLLNGEKSAYRDWVIYNSACALLMADFAEDLKMGVDIAETIIDTKVGLKTLETLIKITNE